MKKKLIFIIAAVVLIAVLLVILFSGNKKTVNDFIVEDYCEVLEQYPDAIYYETDCVLSGYLDELKTKTEVISYESIFQFDKDSVVYYRRNLVDNTLEIEKKYGHWQGSFSSDPRDTKVTFSEALEILEKSNIVKPHSDKMTLRWPLGSKYDHALYIFGSTMSDLYVGVDVISGEVYEVSNKGDRGDSFSNFISIDWNYARSLENDSTRVFFYEVHGTMNGLISEMPEDEVEVMEMQTIFQVNRSAVIRHRILETDEKEDEVKDKPWAGSYEIKQSRYPIMFRDAVKILKHNETYKMPNSNKVTYRQPVGPGIHNPRWIFGSKSEHYYVYVDALTGEVGSMQ